MTTPPAAKSNADFIDSIGVNTHAGYFGYPTADGTQTGAAIATLGIKHVRDSAYLDSNTATNDAIYGTMDEVHTASGAMYDLIVDPRSAGLSTIDATKIASIRTYTAGFLESFEGPNEYDLSGDPSWQSVLTSYQQALYAAVNANGGTEPVVGPSPVFNIVDFTGYVDVSNIHVYYSGRNPGTAPWSFDGYATTQFMINRAVAQSANVPIYATESGYHNALLASGTQPAISEAAGGDYTSRTFLEHFRMGIARTYAYELVDLGADQTAQDATWGILRSDFTEKPAFTTLKNLIAILDDPSPNASPGGLFYSLSGAPTGVHDLLLQDSTGKFYLILWLELPQWDVNTYQAITVPSQSVDLKLGKQFDFIRRYNPGAGTSVVQTITDASTATLSVGTTPMVLELEGPSAYTPTFEYQPITISSSANDAHTYKVNSGTYPPSSGTTYNNTDAAVYVERDFYNSTYHVDNVLLRFNTAAIPDNATITRAALSFFVSNIESVDVLSVTADWGPFTLTSADYTASGGASSASGTSALGSGVALSSLVKGTQNILELTNFASNISKTGNTDLRLQPTQRTSDAAPSGYNFITIPTYDDPVLPAPELLIEYTLTDEGGTSSSTQRMAIKVPQV